MENPQSIHDDPYDIVADPDFGFPGAVAYKTLTGCEKYISDLFVLFDGVVQISRSDAVRMAGRRTNDGSAFNDVKNAIRQLESTFVVKWEFDEKNRPVYTEIFLITGHRRTYSDNHKQILNYYLQINPALSNYIKNGKNFSCMSWSRLSGLSPQAHRLARILYVSLSKLYSKENNAALPYSRDYHFICKNWMGGLKPLLYPTRVKRDQLNKPYKELIDCGLLKHFKVEKNAKGDGMNVVHYMGQGFIDDYNLFYNGQMSLSHQFKSNTTILASKHETLELLDFFTEKYRNIKKGTKVEYLQKEFDYARKLISKFGYEDALSFVAYSIKAANIGGFDMRTFSGTKVYEKDYLSERQKISDQKTKRVQEMEEDQEKELAQEHKYWVISEVEKIKKSLSKSDLARLEKEATKQHELAFPNQIPMEFQLTSRIESLIKTEHSIFGLEEWKENRHNV